jgi:hypothetical protein
MTERERWIVYPLLFLALGAALRDKLSEHTKTKSIECQELTVYGEDGPNQPPVPLVQIGAVKRTSADSPHLGQVLVNGLIQTQALQAEDVQASSVNADNYFFHRIPLAPLMRTVPGVSPADQLRLHQLQQDAAAQAAAAQEAKANDDRPAEANPPQPSDESASPPAE